MTSGNKNLIKFLARVAVDGYLSELSQHRKLSSSITEKQLANELPEKQIATSSCPNILSNPNQPSSSDGLEITQKRSNKNENNRKAIHKRRIS